MTVNNGGDLNNINVKGETPLAAGSESMLKLLSLKAGTKLVASSHSAADHSFDNNKLLSFTSLNQMARH